MEKQAAIVKQGSTLRAQLIKVAAENGHNMGIARYNAFAKAAGEPSQPYKSAEFRRLVREIDSLVGLALADE